ncbi:MAG TPA: 4-hydroxythreonine-4-phosphate dehydrogenase PdxA, partial [Gammaproteobacteria bacterium]|nr:4-hydroxythreonine-4-phosphate dehydrogenase PdxA [Gammaproteobacteria bacterium]
MANNAPLIVVSSGEPAGIGPDISLALASRPFAARLAVLGDLELMRSRARLLGSRIELIACTEPGDVAEHQLGRLHVLPIALPTPTEPGKLDTRNAAYVLSMLHRGTELCVAGTARALVTAPVQKSVITQSGVAFSGHTELLAELTGAPQPVMLLAGKKLRVALATTHLPLRAVPAALERSKLESLIRILHRDMQRRFRIARPRVLVLGLNPHAGE